MKTRIVIAILGWVLLQIPALGQCNNDLVNIAMEQSGKDVLFIREFRVKLKKGTVRNPVPSGKFNVYCKEGSVYRFNIVSDPSSGSKAVLQLFDNGKCLGSTYDNVSNENRNAFDYRTQKTGSYQVVISFQEGEPGCAAGIMSLVENKGTVKSDTVLTEKIVEMETLYMNVENPLSIITDNEPTDTMILTVDNGIVIQKSGNYYLRPETEGLATLRVLVKDRNGKLKDEAKSDFLVRRMPAPAANVQGFHGGLITRSSIQLAETLNIDSPIDFEKYGYRVVDFEVKIGPLNEKRLLNTGKRFGNSLKNLLADLPEDSRLIFDSIHVRTPAGQVITLEPIAFVVR